MQISSRGLGRKLVFLWIGWLCLAASAMAQTRTTILPNDIYSSSGSAGANSVIESVTVSGQPFSQAYRVTVGGTSTNVFDAGLWIRTAQAVSEGDNLVVTFWVRKVSPLDGNNIRGFVGFEKASAPFGKSLYTVFPCDGDTWTKYSLPFKAAASYAAGEAQLIFHFAHGPQVFELGGISAVNLGKTPPVAVQPVSVLPANVYGSFSRYFDPQVGGSTAVVGVAGQNFTQAIQFTTNGDSDFVYRSGLGWNTATEVKKGDVLVLSFWARKLEPVNTAVIRAQVVFERNGSPFDKSLSVNFPNDSGEWRRYQLPFKAHDNFAVGQAHLVLQFAFGPQKFEVGGVALDNYGQTVSLSQFKSEFYYPGRGEVNALWRLAAAERINQYRKGELTVTVRDRNGNALPGAQVFVQQTNHAFKFGSAVTAQLLAGNGQTAAEREQYRSRVSSHFTTTVLENDLKWPFWEDWASWNRQATMNALTWLKNQNLTVRGHNLIWPASDNLPSNVRSLTGDALRQRIDQHFAEILNPANAGGKCYQWDVVNEPYTNYDLQGRIAGVANVTPSGGKLGNDEIIRWFQLTRQLDPQAKLFVNDYDILAAGGADVNHQNYLFELTRWMLAQGAPVDGVGLQGHFDRITPPALMQTIIERFSTLPTQLAVTEFDINMADEDLQAEFTRDVMTMIFSQPKFTDFLMWGFWEKAHWLPTGAMYRADWSSKPNALVYNDLVFREWWTNENGATDAAGKFRARGFKGSYNVTAVFNRISQTVATTIEDNGEVSVTLDVASPRSPIRRDQPRQIGQ
ncbi:MAG TPA: endo-1,4-beta-xylanase [Blastocatellia bacterium]|nr:endo-1,4-beta-xylanase [Blastocatellia bacterium]HMZ16782.1 endo-1,4-beta-xylanase [Blastocatellia bacterium]HNG30410.1 endo-1,4-beta-xylanase [Blastocatellia bacterium]